MITVCVMSYKYGHLVAHAVDSVLSQTRKPDHVMVIDDGIGDCRHIPNLYPEVEFIERPENLGTIENFHDTLMRVTTDKFLMLGADNWLRQDALEILDKSEADIVTYDIVLTGTEHDRWQKKVNITHTEHGYPYWAVKEYHGSMLMNTQKAQEVGYRCAQEHTKTLEDQHIYKGMKENGATQEHINEGLLYYRRHRENFNAV